MDPNAALRLLLWALADGDRDEAIDAAEALSEWLRKGGFMPSRNLLCTEAKLIGLATTS